MMERSAGRNTYLMAAVVLIGVVGAVSAVYLDVTAADETLEQGHTVWDCTFEDDDICVETDITEHHRCDGEDRYRQDHCRHTDDGVENVTMVTDSANFVTASLTTESYDIESLDIGQNRAWDAEFLDDGRFIYTEMDGTLTLHSGGHVIEEAQIDDTEKFGNTGLLGVAADPAFDENRHVYLYYYVHGTFPRHMEIDITDTVDPLYNRVSRFEFRDGELQNETVLIDDIEGSSGHSGGRIAIGPDDYLYVTTGDAEYVKTDHGELHERVQDRDFLGGKVLRTTLNGSVPKDNPFDDSYVYAEGFRNPQGIDFHPETGEPFVSMHGPWRHDEVNVVDPGANYGWPAEKCGYDYQDVTVADTNDPLYCFEEWTIAPSGTTFVDDPDHPWYGSYFVTGLRGSMLYRIVFGDDHAVEHSEVFYIRKADEIDNRLRNVEFHDGSLYLFGDGYGVGTLTPGDEQYIQ